MISLLTSISKGWFNQTGGFTFEEQYYMDPLVRWQQDREMDAFVASQFPEYDIQNLESNLVQPQYRQPNQVLVGGIQPNLIVGACLGADFLFYPEYDADIQGAPLAGIKSADELPDPASLLDHPLLKTFDQQIESLRTERPDLQVIPPFFWDNSGRATIHGFITTSLKFFGTDIFLLMVQDPGFVLRIHDWLTDVYVHLIKHYVALADLPVTSVHIGECSGTMIRGRHYDEFIVPFASRIGRELGPVRMHSCGKSDHLLAAISRIDKLAVLDTGSGTSVANVREIFGPDFQIDVAPPVELMMATAKHEEIATWLDQTLAENGDGPLLIGYHYEPGYSLENCLFIHDELARRGYVEKGRYLRK